MRVIVGITGASGVVLGVRLVEALREHEVIPVVTRTAWALMEREMGGRPGFGQTVYAADDFHAPVASSSFLCDGMAVVPCSMKTLAGIATGYADTLVIRAAENMLRMGKRVVLVPRETPLSLAAIENLLRVKQAGAIVLPPALAFYPQPRSVDDMIHFIVGKVLDGLGIPNRLYNRWEG